MLTVHKYPLGVIGRLEVGMPEGAIILSLQVQRGKPCMWALVDTEAPIELRYFWFLETGCPATSCVLRDEFIGTVQFLGGSYVLHLFEENKREEDKEWAKN